MGVRVCSHVPCGAPCCVAVRGQRARTFPFALLLLRGAHLRRAVCHLAARGGLLNADHAPLHHYPNTAHGFPVPAPRRAARRDFAFVPLRGAQQALRDRSTASRGRVLGLRDRIIGFCAAQMSAARTIGAFVAHSARAFRTPHHCAVRSRRSTPMPLLPRGLAESAQIPPCFAHFCALTHPSARAKLLNFR